MGKLSQIDLECSEEGLLHPSLKDAHQSFAEALGNPTYSKGKIPKKSSKETKNSIDKAYEDYCKRTRRYSKIPRERSDSETYDRDDDSDYTK